MTVSPSLATIEDAGTSSILDASNYVIQAISFGTAEEAFNSEGFGRGLDLAKAQYMTTLHNQYLAGQVNTHAVATREDANSSNDFYPTAKLLPSTPDPIKTRLENNTNISSVPGDFVGTAPAVSSLFPGNGQHVNFIPSAIRETLTVGTPFSGTLSSLFLGVLMGSYPAGASEQGSTGSLLVYRRIGQARAEILTTGSYPNEASSMDVSGYITSVSGTDPSSGLITSSNADFSSNGTIEYSTKLSKDDAAFLQLFGGIYHLGMWTIDMKQSLLSGNAPPFGFSVLNNPRKYKLFCRKGVTKDLTFITDISSFADLTIKWRLHFL